MIITDCLWSCCCCKYTELSCSISTSDIFSLSHCCGTCWRHLRFQTWIIWLVLSIIRCLCHLTFWFVFFKFIFFVDVIEDVLVDFGESEVPDKVVCKRVIDWKRDCVFGRLVQVALKNCMLLEVQQNSTPYCRVSVTVFQVFHWEGTEKKVPVCWDGKSSLIAALEVPGRIGKFVLHQWDESLPWVACWKE